MDQLLSDDDNERNIMKRLFFALLGSALSMATVEAQAETMSAQYSAPQTGTAVDLPAGWFLGAPPKSGVATLGIRGTNDMVLAGVLPIRDEKQVAAQLTAQGIPGYTIERVIPLQTVMDTMLQTGLMMKSADGKTAAKYVFVQPLPDGTTALAALHTLNLADKQALGAKMQGILAVMAQLKAGRVFSAKAVSAK
jgi:invasion protein IalB